MATFEDFMKLDIRVGEIVQVEIFEKAKRPAYKLWVDFGDEIGIKKSSAQITERRRGARARAKERPVFRRCAAIQDRPHPCS